MEKRISFLILVCTGSLFLLVFSSVDARQSAGYSKHDRISSILNGIIRTLQENKRGAQDLNSQSFLESITENILERQLIYENGKPVPATHGNPDNKIESLGERKDVDLDNQYEEDEYGPDETIISKRNFDKNSILWPDGKVPYEVKGFKNTNTTFLRRAITIMHEETCVEFLNIGQDWENVNSDEILPSGDKINFKHTVLIDGNNQKSKVADVQRELDPEGVSMRRRHQLSRRIYSNKGPNYLIHLDGYDKLKRYGFPIHGAICGFSRRVLWLKVANTNNNPKVVASHFMEFVNEIKGVPRCIRMDNGTENVLIEDIQMAFRWDHSDQMAGTKSVIKGSSHSNQRIERWWRSNKQGGCQFWIDLFKDLEASGHLSTSNEMQIECMRFCFFGVLQNELDRIKREWNQHSIRKNRKSESPSGKPEIMYHLPNLYETVDYKTGVRQEDIDAVRFYCHVPFSCSCKEENSIFFTRCMNEFGLLPPNTADGALELFTRLKNHLNL